MTGLIIAAVYVAFTVVMVMALTYSGRTPIRDSRIAIPDDADVWWNAVDSMPDVAAQFAHILAEQSERTET